MAKWWALLFGVVMLASTLLFVVAPFVGWWLPGAYSTHAGGIDGLFYIILIVTGFFFILTEGLLILFMWRFGAHDGPPAEGAKAAPPGHSFAERMARPFKKYIPDEHRLELIWTAIPGIILFVLAVGQIPVWMGIKYVSLIPRSEKHKMPLHVGVSARQFEWRMRYPSPATWKTWKEAAKENPKAADKMAGDWAKQPHFDDIHVVNELHVWTDSTKVKDWEAGNATAEDFPAMVCHLSTLDVQHNLNMPHMRIKQDALPGKLIPVWFRPTKWNTTKTKLKDGSIRWEDGGGWDEFGHAKDKLLVWEIACAELCGRWHYHMIAKVYVHPSEEDFLAWLEAAEKKQNSTEREDISAGK